MWSSKSSQVAGLEGVTLIGGAALLVAEFMAAPESEGIYFPGPELTLPPTRTRRRGKAAQTWTLRIESRYGEEPTSAYMHHAYDAATLLLWAIENTAMEDGDTLRD